MLEPVFEARVTHTGLYADGRPNVSSILINDLDEGFEYQNRKVPVYVPAGGSIDIALTSRSLFSINQGTLSKLVEAGLVIVTILTPGRGTSLTQVVDNESVQDFENGSWDYPWKTIQRGINAIWGDADDPTPAGPTVSETGARSLIISGGGYDEDLVLPVAGGIVFNLLGPVDLGTPTSPRSITRIVDPTLNPSAPFVPNLTIGLARDAGMLIWGGITLADVTGLQVQNLIMNGGGVIGNFDATGQTDFCNLIFDGVAFGSPVWTAPTGRVVARETQWFGGTPSLDYFSRVIRSEFFTGFTVASDPIPVIYRDTVVFGTVTSATDPVMDYSTNESFAANAVVKAGGWAATIPFGRVAPY